VEYANEKLADATKSRYRTLQLIGMERPQTTEERVALIKSSTDPIEAARLLASELPMLLDAWVASLQTDFEQALSELRSFCQEQGWHQALRHIEAWAAESPTNRASTYNSVQLDAIPMR
jgi:hypothetical protein